MPAQPSLLSPAGRELLELLAAGQAGPGQAGPEQAGPEQALALARSLRGRYQADLIAQALTQQALRAAGREKFSQAGQMLFTRDGLEQASSELTAARGAARYAPARRVADLCCGIGGSLTALARAGTGTVIAADRDLVSLRYARHNAAVYRACHGPGAGGADGGNGPGGAGEENSADGPGAGREVGAVCADVRDLTLRGIDAVWIDPARRAGGRRLPAGASEPPLDWCLSLAEAVPAVGIKAAPGLARELIPAGWEAEFVAVGRDLKEALLWSPALATASRRATVLPAGGPKPGQDGTPGGPGDSLAGPGDRLAGAGPAQASANSTPVPVAPPGAYLIDPSPAITRAGLVTELAGRLGAWKIDPMIAFLSADSLVRSPFGRTLRVLESAPWREKDFARRLRALQIGAADIRRRGLAGDTDQIRRRLRLRGPAAATIVLTRAAGRPWGLICVDVAGDEPG